MAVNKKKQEDNIEKRSLQEVVGKGYATFWHFKGLEVYMQGGKGSKKSKTCALRWIYLLTKYPQACLLVTRKVADTLRDSAFADLKWAIEIFGLQRVWRAKLSPLSIVNVKTGQKIYFRGLDDFQKIASITTDRPELKLCWVWHEEAFEVDDKDTFNRVNNSIRGKLPDDYFKQFVYSFNPWQESNYVVKQVVDNLKPNKDILEEKGKQELVKSGFYEIEDKRNKDGVKKVPVERLYMITNYKINEFLSDADRAVYEEMKIHEPTRYQVEGLGMPGVEPGDIFRPEWPSFTDLYEDAPKLSWKCLSVDATFKKESITKGHETDYVAIQVWGISEDNHFYLLNRRKKHLSFLETCDEIDELVRLNPDLNAILIEDKANGSAIIEMMRRKYPVVLGIEPKGGKLSRGQAVAPMFENGTVKLPNRPWIGEYTAEFVAFPNGDHDDEVDATSQALMRLKDILITKLTEEDRLRKQMEDEEYERTKEALGVNGDTNDYMNFFTNW